MGGSAVSSGTDLSVDVYEPSADTDLLETQTRLQEAVRTLITGIGEDEKRDGLRDTPKRVAKAWLDASSGYRKTAKSVVGGALFHEPEIANSPGGLVIVRDVDFASTSETSLLPFYGRCHLGYLPSHGVVLGLSKVARLVAMLAKRLQTQERFTQELINTFEAEVLPQGCAVIVEANQLEYGKRAHVNISSARSGCFLQSEVMEEFETLLRFSGPGKAEAVRGLQEGPDLAAPGVVHSTGKSADDTRLRYSASSAVTNGLEECMEEAEHEGGTSTSAALEGAVLAILREIGEDPRREGLSGSAQRYVRFLLASTAGYKEAMPHRNGSLHCPEPSRQQSAAQPPAAQDLHIHFMSHCEHHMLPFHGQVHVAYLLGSSGHHVPLERLQALVKTCSRRLQIQERLTQEIADGVFSLTGGYGALVACEASHMCMVARGVEKHASSTITTAARGAYLQRTALRSQMLQRLMQHQSESERRAVR